MLNTMSDMELVQEVKEENLAAFRTLYFRHVDNVFGLVTRVLGPFRSDREDVVQEVFFQTHRSIARFKGDSSFATWLRRIAINVTYSHLRRVPYQEDLRNNEEWAAPDTWSTGENHLHARRTVRQMFELLNQTSAKNRIVFTLYEFEGLTLDKISTTLNIPLHTAASRLRRTRELLMRAVASDAAVSEGERT